MSDPWLPERGTAVHIGLYKTGTTAIQASLEQARRDMRKQRLLYPGRNIAHNKHASSVMQRKKGWDSEVRTDDSLWRELVGQVAKFRGRSIVSSEHLCEADPDIVRRVVRDLGGDRVRLIVTLRPLEMILPSTWQQYVKSGLVTPYLEWLEQVLNRRKSKTPSFWRRNDLPDVLNRWTAEVPPADVAVVILPPGDRDFIFRSFEDVLGLPTGMLTPSETAFSNRSLTLNEAEVLRRFNEYAHGNLAYPIFNRTVRMGAGTALVERRRPSPDEKPIRTPGWAIELARGIDRQTAEVLRQGGYRIVGEVDSLLVDTPIPPDDPADFEVPEDVPIDAAYHLLRGMAERIRD